MQTRLELNPVNPTHRQGGLLDQRGAGGGAGREDGRVYQRQAVERLRGAGDRDTGGGERYSGAVHLGQPHADI